MANGIAPGGQLTTTTEILTEIVNKVDFSTTPFKIFTDSKAVIADSIIVAMSVIAKRLDFLGSGHEPTTKFLDGQLELDSSGYVVTKLGTTQTNKLGVFSVRDV
uniref:Uncharacterized protein n=1 Tax=Quercus lobata TaxID=97700 RepID=A0A7N2L378_QUELO